MMRVIEGQSICRLQRNFEWTPAAEENGAAEAAPFHSEVRVVLLALPDRDRLDLRRPVAGSVGRDSAELHRDLAGLRQAGVEGLREPLQARLRLRATLLALARPDRDVALALAETDRP